MRQTEIRDGKSMKLPAGLFIVSILLLGVLTITPPAFAAGGSDAASLSSGVENSAAEFRASLFELFDALPHTRSLFVVIWYSMTDFQGMAGFIRPALNALIVFAIGWCGFLLIGPRRTRRKLNARVAEAGDGLTTLLYSALSLVLELISVWVFYFFAHTAAVYFFEAGTANRALVDGIVMAQTWVLLFNAVMRAVLSPNNSNLRLMPLQDREARFAYKSLVGTFAVLQLGLALIAFLGHMGMYQPLVVLMTAGLTLAVNLAFIAFIWLSRKQFNQVFYPHGSPNPDIRPVAAGFYRNWPIVLSVWLLVIWAIWSFNLFIGNTERADKVAVCWWITLSFPILDRAVQMFLDRVIADKVFNSPINRHRGERFVTVIQTGVRLVLLAFAVFTVTKAWGFQGASQVAGHPMVQKFFDVVVELGVVAVVGFAIWEIVQGWAESKMPESDIDPIAALELDGGGQGGTRTETLLPLLRTVMSIVLAIFLVLTALYVVGVQIGPLLAGAGVIGIAVGFGAQKLVQDVISGIFFLVDDAFRMGEYVEVGSMKGTVEKISIRSMQLRHHLGAVQTIPYGEMATVKNLSRDWVTMKLELRVPYDTDIEKLRKAVKKIGLALKEHPEHGSKFILPLKSQGVNRVEESALIVRVKFTCRPGDQWVIRRLGYQEIRDGLAKIGIHFAHREVRVHMPEDQALPALEAAPKPVEGAPDEPARLAEPVAAEPVAAGAPAASGGTKSLQDSVDNVRQSALAAAGIAAMADELARKYDSDDGGDYG